MIENVLEELSKSWHPCLTEGKGSYDTSTCVQGLWDGNRSCPCKLGTAVRPNTPGQHEKTIELFVNLTFFPLASQVKEIPQQATHAFISHPA